VHLKGTNSMAVSGPSFGNILVGTGWTNSLVLCINELRKQSSHLIRSPFLAMKNFPVWMNGCWPKSHDYCKLINGSVWFQS